MREFVVPGTYEEWRYCITVKCRLELDREFIDSRLAALRNPADEDTRRFTELYGDDHRQLVIEWFERAKAELKTRTW